MSTVYKDKKSKNFQTNIWIGGQKYSRSTRSSNRREAEAVARRLETELREQVKAEAKAGTSLQLGDVAARYMLDVGDHHAGAANTDRGEADPVAS